MTMLQPINAHTPIVPAPKKRRMLVWADSPTVSTGFAQVSRNILRELHKTGKWEIDMAGINFHGDFDRDKFDREYSFLSRIVPAQAQNSGDMYGREQLIKTLAGYHPVIQPPYDVFFSIQDHFIIQQKDSVSSKGLGQAIKAMQKNTLNAKEVRDNHFLWVGYFPVDGMLKEHWVDEAIAMCDYPVAYCEYGVAEILKFDNPTRNLKNRLKYIYHGTNIKDFYPLSPEEKKKARRDLFRDKVNDDTFVFINVARNQPRKDLFKVLVVFNEWLKNHPNSILYMHCDPTDLAGGNLFDMGKFIGLPMDKLHFSKSLYGGQGVPLSVLNKMYNASDAFLTTTLGEGWGLPITEAMACKLPVYAPNVTSISDILNTHGGFNPTIARGICFDAGSTPTEWTNAGNLDNEVPRPITNVESAVKMLEWGFANQDKVAQIVERGYQWTQEHTWEHEIEKWIAIFDEACEVNDQLRRGMGAVSEAVGRNDSCPACLLAGKTIKVKKCEQHRALYLK